MSIEEHLREFAGLPVFEFPSLKDQRPLPDTGEVAWRLQFDEEWGPRYEKVTIESFEEKWQRFLAVVEPSRVRALVIGNWSSYCSEPAEQVAELLVGAADRLTGLRAVFFGDLVREESDLSYLPLCDLAPVARAYPRLEELACRGAETFGVIEHPALRSLRFESGGLPREVLANVLASELPQLERLTLWLGVDDYGGDIALPDLAPLLDGRSFPRLRHLGLEDSELTDVIAAALAGAPVVAGLERLSLALGTLSDEGATALLEGQPLTHLSTLDLHHHFLTDPMIERLNRALGPAGVAVDLSHRNRERGFDGEVWRYVANAE
ncbi:STM4015 family protein [Kitasatospora kifunensis]|uniref:Cytoplasmic protein n=1 Tax=Kitasatospora kifunensis TaxID=58351 RepID=A0A7W7QWV3_KITKI|nr:STM4015 family protein [Kitasatospora kifunensis]MBB4921243.1 hypothetical protein [Kitasatospora kifunensis]